MSSLCQTQLNHYNESLSRRELWAMRMLDMYSKLPAGILHGNTRHFGLFTECLNFRHNSGNESVGIIEGQYCTVNHVSASSGKPIDSERLDWRDIGLLARSRNLRFESGICVPLSCGDAEVKSYANTLLGRADLTATGVFCQHREPISLAIVDYFVIAMLSLLLLVVIGSTIYEVLSRKRPHEPRKPLAAFSLYGNTRELLTIDGTESRRVIACMNGLRSLAAFWVIAGHRIFRDQRMMSRPLNPANGFAAATLALMMTVDYAVDVFFLLSAILVTQSCLRALHKGKLSLPRIYLNRYLRYTPSVLFLLLFMLSFIPYALVNGPSIRFLDQNVQMCRDHWWSTILMVQNYVNVNSICIGHTWYLNADYQLYLLSPLFIYLLFKFGYKAFYAFAVVIVAVQISVFVVRYHDIVTEHVVYRRTHFRIGQWLVGIAFGYVMHRIDQGTNDFKLRRRVKYTCWLVTATAFLATEVYYQLLRPNTLSTAIYEATHRIFVTCFFGWLVLALHHLKSGGFVRWFLAHPLWQPTAKLSLSIYLVHDLYIILSVTNIKELMYFDVSWMMHLIAGDIVLSILLGTGLYLLVEAPTAKLLNYYLK